MNTSDVKHLSEKRIKVDLAFLPEEREVFRAYLERTGRKAGPWVRVLILEAIAKDSRREPSQEVTA